jgi:predicted nucleic acid-binding protein
MFLIDTNIFLEVMLARAKRTACINFLESVRAGREEAVVTDFTIYSIMVILDGHGKLRELNRFLCSISAYKGLSIYAASLEDKIQAVELADNSEFDIDDAVQYASARSVKAKAIVSLDRDFDGHDIPRSDPSSLTS